jgi:Skp family chaperone for outer membrane proteins
MRPEVRSQKEQELQRELMQLQQTYVQMQRELMSEETRLTRDISERIKAVVGKIGDRDGYTMILNIGESVLYHKRHMDITDDVVAAYNKQYLKN